MKNKCIRSRGLLSLIPAVCLLILMIGCAANTKQTAANPNVKGSFTIVGMGPGDADLITPRAVEAIRKADLIFCNTEKTEKIASVVDIKNKQVLDGYGLLFRFYGKDCAQFPKEEQSWRGMNCEEYHKKQAEFVDLVRRSVQAGKHVAVLSGGDPTIYGPDMWSLQALSDLNPTVVPGLSAFNAANAALKVSLGEVIITAPFKKENHKDTIENLAGHEQATMVIFMPQDMKELFARLAKAFPADTPTAIVSNAGIADREKAVSGTVGQFAVSLPEVDSKLSIVYVGKALSKAHFMQKPAAGNAAKGKFYLIGTGPGDADLLTLRAIKAIEKSDLIFASQKLQERYASLLKGKTVIDGYGRLFPFYGKKCAEVSEAEKRTERMSCEEYQKKQAEFAAMTREAVAQGKTVAMLDSGDPLVYGPCSWTLTELSDLNTEVVAGLSCFNAANAALRVGVTEGETSHSMILASGWTVDEMAVHQSAMSLFTMRTEFKKFIDALSKHYPSNTPVAIVSNAGYAEKEKVLHGELGTILTQLGENKLPFEYLLYVGDFLKNSVDRIAK